MRMKPSVAAAAAALLLISSTFGLEAQRAAQNASPLVTGLDHVIILVNDLDAAASRYRAMGFALKPGRPHDIGRNKAAGADLRNLARISRRPLSRSFTW